MSNEEIWQNIGFHRPLAGFFYNLVFMFFGVFFGIFIGSFLFNLMYPFPESLAILFHAFARCHLISRVRAMMGARVGGLLNSPVFNG
jgi:hypothetical protein